MPTPDFIVELRDKVGHAPLWLSGVAAVVIRDEEVLLVRRADNGEWTPVTGIIDPGEEPAHAAVREVLEEASVVAVVERLVWVRVDDPIIYPNGDHSQYLALIFRCSYAAGDAAVGDDENTDVQWFPLDQLPHLTHKWQETIRVAVANEPEALFAP